ncbi:class I SAM-dependent methyltransferase [Streptomyces sp. NPDC056053]|uniref:class I SAM-dependent methyltransferase n=1 Tax=Streptomyces sp. NPDC056053 TaxID=3345696 RepID=UPI0035E12F81
MKFEDVLTAWDGAETGDIHPLWTVSEEAYWRSGWDQVSEIAEYARRGQTVVDFGCGNGRLTGPLAELGYDVIGVDASQTMLDAAKARLNLMGVKARLELSDGLDLSRVLGKKRAALVVARAVLIHHAPEDVERLLRSMVRVLRKGGVIVADLPVGSGGVRKSWIDVTWWDPQDRAKMVSSLGLEFIDQGDVAVMRKK